MNTVIIKLFFSLIFIGLSTSATAYIPSPWLILDRTARNHGKGVYKISQDVIFNHSQEQYVLNEEWIIDDLQHMRVNVTGKRALRNKVNFSIIYNRGVKYYLDNTGKKVAKNKGNNNLEDFFHFREVKSIRKHLLENKIINTHTKTSEALFWTPNQERKKIKGLRLARTDGTIAYAFGTPSTQTEKNPGLWIEQDKFIIKKIRLADKSEVLAKKYRRYNRSLYLPTERSIFLGQDNVEIQILKVSPLTKGKKVKALLRHHSLKDRKEELKNPEDAFIEQFYQKYR